MPHESIVMFFNNAAAANIAGIFSHHRKYVIAESSRRDSRSLGPFNPL